MTRSDERRARTPSPAWAGTARSLRHRRQRPRRRRPPPRPTPAQPTFTAGDLPPNGPAPAWTPGPRQSYTRRRRRRVGGIIIPLFIIGIFAVGIGGFISVFNAGSNALDGIQSTIDAATNSTTTTTTRPSDGTSLMAPAALKAALAKLPDGDIELLRLAPDRINANVIVDGKMHVVQVTAGGEVIGHHDARHRPRRADQGQLAPRRSGSSARRPGAPASARGTSPTWC